VLNKDISIAYITLKKTRLVGG